MASLLLRGRLWHPPTKDSLAGHRPRPGSRFSSTTEHMVKGAFLKLPRAIVIAPSINAIMESHFDPLFRVIMLGSSTSTFTANVSSV